MADSGKSIKMNTKEHNTESAASVKSVAKLSRIQLIQQARRLACEHIENARIVTGNRFDSMCRLDQEQSVRKLAEVMLLSAILDLLTEDS